MRTIGAWLREERGEGSVVATIAGSILFLLASVSIFGFAVTSLGASDIAQANSELTAALVEDTQTWEKTPWGDIDAQAAAPYELDVAGRTYEVTRRITLIDEINAYRVDTTAPRIGLPGTVPTDCSGALDKVIEGCITVSGTVTATSDELTPRTPKGVTLVTERIDIGAGADTLIAADFEDGADGFDFAGGTAEVVTVYGPRAGGTSALRLNGGMGPASALSTKVSIAADSRIAVNGWVRGEALGSSATLQAMWSYPNGASTTTDIGTITAEQSVAEWKRISGTLNVPAGATGVALRVALSCSTWSEGCTFELDDVRVVALARNLIADPGVESGADWEIVGDFAHTDTTGQNANTGSKGIVVDEPGDGYFTAPPATISEPGTYIARIWVKATVATASTGVITFELLDEDGNTLASVDRQVAALNTAYTAVTIPVTVGSGVSQISLRALTNGITGRTVTLDDASLVQQTGAHPDPSAQGYIHLATFDPTQFEEAKSFRVSFEWDGDGAAPDNLVVAIYCGVDGKQLEVSKGQMSVLQTATENPTEWEWARIILPELGRLQACEAPTMRLYYDDGGAPEASAVSKLSVLPVMAGIKTPGS